MEIAPTKKMRIGAQFRTNGRSAPSCMDAPNRGSKGTMPTAAGQSGRRFALGIFPWPMLIQILMRFCVTPYAPNCRGQTRRQIIGALSGEMHDKELLGLHEVESLLSWIHPHTIEDAQQPSPAGSAATSF